MSERKNEILENFRRPIGKSSRSRDLKERLQLIRSKETFLTDTQTSDYNKSSGQINSSRVEHLKDLICKLQKENSELRQRVIDLKASHFLEVNEEKLKSIIMQNDYLRDQLQGTKKQLQQSLVQRDFLQRFNKNLKSQCEALTKQILLLKASFKGECKKIQKNIYTARDEAIKYRGRDEVSYEKGRNPSKDSVLSKKKEFTNSRKGKDQKQRYGPGTLKSCLSASRLHQDYYEGSNSRQRPFKHL